MQLVGAASVPTLSLSQVQAQTGENVKMQLSIEGNPGIIAMRVFVQYDASVLQLVSAENGEIFEDNCATFGKDIAANPYTMLWDDSLRTTDITANGTLAVLTFHVLPSAKAGTTTVTLAYDDFSVFDCRLSLVAPFTMQNGSVNVTKPTVHVTGVTVPLTLSLKTGETSTLTATVFPAEATDRTVSWKSGNPSVATVDANGTVRAISVGKAVITATTTDGGKTASCTVTVQQSTVAVTGVSLPSSLTMNYKDSARLTATVEPADATNAAVRWSSSDSKIVEVDANGNLTTHKKGTATITATTVDGGKAASCRVTVQYTFVQKIIIYLLFGWIWYVK